MIGASKVGVRRAALAKRHGGAVTQVRHFGANLKDIQMRIVSTQNIQKITKSMKMVSAAKLRGDQDRLEKGRAFGQSMLPILNATPGEEEVAIEDAKNPLYLVLSSDRGLCGGVNSFVAKETGLAINKDLADGADPKIFVAGEKASSQLARLFPDRVIGQILERSKTPSNFAKALVIADRALGAAPEADAIKIVYNRFISAIKFETEIISVPNYALLNAGEDESTSELPFPLGRYEGELESTEEGLMNLTEYSLATTLYGCMLESATSEQSSRMNAMQSSSDNAAELVDKLTVQYNRARQAKITTELIEIISGAESLNA